MTFVSKRAPRIKQAEALARMNGHNAFALLMAMRTGKTKVILDEWQRDVAQYPDLLVIAPAGVYRTWETAIAEDVDDRLIAQTQSMIWVSGKTKNIEAFLQADGPRVLLMNIEALSGVATARAVVNEFVGRGSCTVVVDESVVIKNVKARRTKFVQSLSALAKRRRILSGLPTPRSPLDLYAQFEFLDWRILGFRSYYAFRNRYAIVQKVIMPMARYPVPIIRGYRDVEELQRKIAPYSFRVRLEDCTDLPPSIYTIRDVPLTPEQTRIYGELKQFATAKINAASHVTAQLVITQMLRMHQVLCGFTTDESGVLQEIPERRTETLIDLLEDHDGKAIIWCPYDHSIQRVADELAKHFKCKVARFWGGNRATREDEELMFKQDPDCWYMVATASAGGRGRTWDVADLVVYYANLDNLDHRMQSEERAKNVGKTNSVLYVDLAVRDSVDMKFLKAMREKINLSSAITGDGWQQWIV